MTSRTVVAARQFQPGTYTSPIVTLDQAAKWARVHLSRWTLPALVTVKVEYSWDGGVTFPEYIEAVFSDTQKDRSQFADDTPSLGAFWSARGGATHLRATLTVPTRLTLEVSLKEDV